MKEFKTASEINVACAPQLLYEFVTTPMNWVGTHPATKAVRGETASPSNVGDHWFEVVSPLGGHQFEAEWRVTKADSPRLWQIESNDIGGLPAIVTITYRIDETSLQSSTGGTGSHFEREMVFSLPDDFPVSEGLRAALTSREGHDTYLVAVKKRIEGTDRR